MEPNDSVSAEQPVLDVAKKPLRAIVSIAGIWLVMSALGASFLYFGWKAQHQIEIGTTRAAVFVAAMTVVCLVGYRLYRSQSPRADSSAAGVSQAGVSWAVYWPALKVGIVLQSIILLLSALTLDLGETLHISTVAAIAYWPLVALILCRRPSSPTPVDLVAIRWGYLLILLLVKTVGPHVWEHLRR